MPQWSRDNTGRFTTRPFYTESEIESLASATLRTLTSAGLEVAYPLTDGVLELLVESLTESYDPYKNMSKLGLDVDVDGYTIFSRTGKPQVYLNDDLSDKKYRTRRRMTIAHEIGHVALHQTLYEQDDRQLDLLVPPDLVPVYCFGTAQARSVDWCEWQANFFGGFLLMPTSIVLERLSNENSKWTESHEASSHESEAAVGYVAREFDVSRDAARVRLSQMGLVKPPGTVRLGQSA